MTYKPPGIKTEYWCDTCGLKQWSRPYKSHKVFGQKCNGTVIEVTYSLTHKVVVIDQGKPKF